MGIQRWSIGIGTVTILVVSPLQVETAAQSCQDGICASPIVCNECGDWEDDHSGHTAPPEATHISEIALYYPVKPSGGAPVGGDFDVVVYWRSYHRAMNKGVDGGHCAKFCSQKDVGFNQCSFFWGLDGLGLQPEKTVRHAGPTASPINIYRIEGPYQNHEYKWEWAEQSWQSGIGNTYSCALFAGGHHDWTSRPTDIMTAKFKVNDWNGSSWGQSPDYELFWDEDDGAGAGGNDDLDFRITTSQPGLVALRSAVENCLKHGSADQRFTLHRDAVLMLCENRNLTDRCDDHLFEIWFDVQCRWDLQFYASITGSQYINLHQSAQYTASLSGGTAPFTYEWRVRQGQALSWESWSPWYSTGTTNYTYASLHTCGYDRFQLEVAVRDSRSYTANATYTVYILNPC